MVLKLGLWRIAVTSYDTRNIPRAFADISSACVWTNRVRYAGWQAMIGFGSPIKGVIVGIYHGQRGYGNVGDRMGYGR